MEDIPHNVDIGHLDPDHISSELHLGEAEEARDHSTLDTTPQTLEHYSRKPSLTFNGSTPHTSISYTPGTFSMGAPFSTHHQITCGY